MVITAIGVVALYIRRDSILFSIGLFVLMFAFLSSLFAATGTIGEDWRVIAILEANPNSYTAFVTSALSYGILPIGAGLALCIFALMRSRRVVSGTFRNLLLLTVGCFFTLSGVHYYLAASKDYFGATTYANLQNISYINDFLREVYQSYELVGVFWLITGLFTITISIYGLKKSKERVG